MCVDRSTDGHVLQHAGHELNLPIDLSRPVKGDLCLGGAVRIVKRCPGRSRLGEAPQIPDGRGLPDPGSA